jgi:membrane fusion protein, peptide pheromone/bacteriocin exporter
MYLKTFSDMKKTSVFFMLKPVSAIYFFIITILFMILTLFIWAIFAPMDEIVKASVIIRPNEVISSVKCVINGELIQKNYINNEIVKKGDLLLILDTTFYQKELEVNEKELNKTNDDIYTNEELLRTIRTNKLVNYNSSDTYMNCSSYLIEKETYEKKITEKENQVEREKNKPDSLIIPQNIKDLEYEISQERLNFEIWMRTKEMNEIETKKQLQSKKINIESRIIELERLIKNSTIYASISGKISEIIEINTGDYVFSGEEILRIIPQNIDKLKADIYVDTSMVTKIKIGNSVKIKFAGLSPIQYGLLQTEISLIPPDSTLIDGKIIFKLEADITNPVLYGKKDEEIRLIPGITGDCRIITLKTTVFKMILNKMDYYV